PNLIWGSAFNSELTGRIRVSVVATGIGAGAVEAAPAKPAKVFAFRGAGRAAEAKAVGAAPLAPLTAPMEEMAAPAEDMQASEPEELELSDPVAEDAGGEELLLDSGSMLEPEEPTGFVEEETSGGP